VQPQNGGYGNGILRFPLDLSDVEDYFIPANGVYLDNVSALIIFKAEEAEDGCSSLWTSTFTVHCNPSCVPYPRRSSIPT